MGLMLTRWYRLYGSPTRHELALEPAIAALGFAYRFQHPVWGAAAFLDYYWPDLRVAVEIDGAWGHSTAEDKKKDRARTARLDKLGILVVRVTNGQVDTNPTKTARTARARAEKLRESRPLDSHRVGTGDGGNRPRGVAKPGARKRKRKARRAPGRRARPGRPGRVFGDHPGQGGPRGVPGPVPVLDPFPHADPPYDPAGDAWGPVGVLVDSVNPDFKPGGRSRR